MLNLLRGTALALTLCAPTVAWADRTYNTANPSSVPGGGIVPGAVLECAPASTTNGVTVRIAAPCGTQDAPLYVTVTNPSSGGGSGGTVTQGSPNTVANAWPSYLTQGGTALTTNNVLPTGDTALDAIIFGGALKISAASLPLPAGAAQDATLTGGNQKTQVTTLPALPAGTNQIGTVSGSTVGVTSLPALPAGTNTIGSTAPFGVNGTQTGITTSATPGTFTTAAAANPSRNGCVIQYLNTAGGGSYLYVHFGSDTATNANSFRLTPGQSVDCAHTGSPVVERNAIQVAATIASDTATLNLQ